MADFIRGAFGVSRSSSTKDREPKIDREREKLHASPSTGSDDNIDLGIEDFDPFITSQAETDDVDGSNNVSLLAPPEKEYEYIIHFLYSFPLGLFLKSFSQGQYFFSLFCCRVKGWWHGRTLVSWNDSYFCYFIWSMSILAIQMHFKTIGSFY